MKTKSKRLVGAVLAVVILASAVTLLYGCKKTEHEHEHAAATTATVEANQPMAGEQTICPVEGGTIKKNLYTIYKGKKVYFCCAGCKPEFEKNPEKYIGKLPQFAK